jgi:hypothetical protein
MTFITTWFPGRLQRVLVTCAHCIANQSYDPFFFDLDECERAAGIIPLLLPSGRTESRKGKRKEKRKRKKKKRKRRL